LTIALPSGAPSQLQIDPVALVLVRPDHVEPTECGNLFTVLLVVTPEANIGAAPGHVGGDRDLPRRPRVGDDGGFGSWVLRIQDVT